MKTSFSLPEEREYSLDEAEQRINADLAALELTPHCTMMGSGPYCAWVELCDAQGVQVHVGWGKGDEQAARVGALYEALEHLLAERHAADNADVMQVETLHAGLPAQEKTSLPAPLLADQIEETIACRRYEPLGAGTAFDYPLVLAEPTYVRSQLSADSFDYAGLERYACSSGTAIGGSVQEATLHALNECIERDAVSLFLLQHFFHDQQAPLRVIAPDGLPADVAAMYEAVSRRIGAPLCLLDVSAGFGATTCVALAHRAFPQARPFGAGTSLNPAHAARRALQELLQYYLAQDGDAPGMDPATEHMEDPVVQLGRWPRLAASARMDIETRLATCPIIRGWIEDRPCTDLAEQIASVSAALHAQGMRVGMNVVKRLPSGSAVVNVVVPMFERFFLVNVGKVIAPGTRGRALAVQTGTAGSMQEPPLAAVG